MGTQSSQRSTAKKKKIPPLYGVYLLRSLSKKNSYYIGSTPNPYRRLRQHNGEVSQGAYRTKKKGYRPWRMVLYVHGFPSNVSALQFEHAWQHSYKTRHIPKEKRRHSGVKSSGSGTNIAEKLANCKVLLDAPSFARTGLRVAMFGKEIYNIWLADKYHVPMPDHVLMELRLDDSADDRFITGGNYDQVKLFMQEVAKDQADFLERTQEKFKDNPNCTICHKPIEGLVGACYHCTTLTHLSCLGLSALEENEVVPLKSLCPSCSKVTFWNTIVRNAQSLSEKPDTDTTTDTDEV